MSFINARCIYLSFIFLILTIAVMEETIAQITKPIISFSVGAYHSCVVFDSKRAKCWGNSGSFGMGGGDIGDAPNEMGVNLPFINLGTNVLITKMSCGAFFTCAKIDSGGMKCVGTNEHGQTGLGINVYSLDAYNGFFGDDFPFVNLGTGIDALDFTTGYEHTCVKVTGNKLKCFGSGAGGTLGSGNTTDIGLLPTDVGNNLPFVDLGTDAEVLSVHSGSLGFHTCAILSAPSLYEQKMKCWGQGGSGQLGYSDSDDRGDNPNEMGDNLPLIDFGTESRVKQVAVGDGHTCAVLFDDKLRCFGYGSEGQLASYLGNWQTILNPSDPSSTIDSGKTISKISAGNYHTCIVYDDLLTMKCFGTNGRGELGQGDTIVRGLAPGTMIPDIAPIDLGKGSTTISSIGCGYEYTCVTFSDDTIKCFGGNNYGQLGIGNLIDVGEKQYQMGTNLTYTNLFSPSKAPTRLPTKSPTNPTRSPTVRPSKAPTPPTLPTSLPTKTPTKTPTKRPTKSPSKAPTNAPTLPTNNPTRNPTVPTNSPVSSSPSKAPTQSPTIVSRNDSAGLAVGLIFAFFGVAGVVGYIYRDKLMEKWMQKKPEGDQAVATQNPNENANTNTNNNNNGNNSRLKNFLLALPRV